MNAIRKQLKDVLSITPAGRRTFTGEFELAPDFVGFRGHFPGAPVLPGVCLIVTALLAAEATLDKALFMTRVKSAKFFSPVGPGVRIQISGRIHVEVSPFQVEAGFTREGEKVAKIVLLARPEPASTESRG